jgi:hypothetical protein
MIREARSNSSKMAVTNSTGSDSRVMGIDIVDQQCREIKVAEVTGGLGEAGKKRGKDRDTRVTPLYTIRLDNVQIDLCYSLWWIDMQTAVASLTKR